MKDMINEDIQRYKEFMVCLKEMKKEAMKKKKGLLKIDINNPYVNEDVLKEHMNKIEEEINVLEYELKLCKGVIRRLNSVLKF